MAGRVVVACSCGQKLRVKQSDLGGVGTCPRCGNKVRLTAARGDRSPDDVSVGQADEWYVLIEEKTRGPLTFKQLRRLVETGRVDRDTEVRYRRDGVWMLAEDARGVLSGASPRPDRGKRPKLPKHAVTGALGVVSLVMLVLFLMRPDPAEEKARELARSPQAIIKSVRKSVAVVRGRRSTGSGFLIQPGLLVTNFHVIENELPRNLVVEFPNAGSRVQSYDASLIMVEPKRDLAFLAVRADLPPLVLAKNHHFEPGEEIMIVGSPGLPDGSVVYNAIARGLMSSRLELEGHPFYQLDTPANPGNSGGPVVDGDGRVVGVVTAKVREAERLALAIPVGDLARMADRIAFLDEEKKAKAPAEHRLYVAEQALLPAASLYWTAMVLYVRSLNPKAFRSRGDGLPSEGTLGSVLSNVDRRLISELRLVEDEIRDDQRLTDLQRSRFARLWALYAEIKSAVDAPEGSLEEYADKCLSFGERLKSLKQIIEAFR